MEQKKWVVITAICVIIAFVGGMLVGTEMWFEMQDVLWNITSGSLTFLVTLALGVALGASLVIVDFGGHLSRH